MLETAAALAALLLLMLGGRALLRPRRADVHAPERGGPLVLRPLRRNGVLLALGALLPAVVLSAFGVRAWASGRTGPVGLAAIALAALAALAVSAHQLASAFRQRFVVRDTGIERVGVLTHRHVSWSSIARVEHNPLQGWFFLTLADGSHLWLAESLRGIGDFAEVALRRLPEPALRADPATREALEELAAEARAQRLTATTK